jgi:segregation and condensation protein B
MAKKTPPADAAPGSERTATNDSGFSLDQLSAAFADMLASGEDPYEKAPAAGSHDADEGHGQPLQLDVVGDTNPQDANCEICPKTILEALLFVGSPDNRPLSSDEVAGLMRGVRASEIDDLVRELNADYTARHCPYEIAAEGAGYRLALRGEFHRVRERFYGKLRQARLSQAAIEVLATVAYHEPLTADEVNRLRATPSGPILAQLVRRELLRLERVRKAPGRYHTTPRFLELFGLDSLADLPRSQDLLES